MNENLQQGGERPARPREGEGGAAARGGGVRPQSLWGGQAGFGLNRPKEG